MEFFFNRDISWLRFNERVLQQACDPRAPLLERVKFLQIFTTNLDEFFMKRVGGFKRQEALGIKGVDRMRPAPGAILREIRSQLLPLLAQQAACWNQEISPALEREGILLLSWGDLKREEQTVLERYFDENLFPVLTPLAVDPGHPFPFISNLSTSFGVLLRNPVPHNPLQATLETEELFARVKIPNSFPGWLKLKPNSGPDSDERFINIREVLSQFMSKLFPGMDILGTLPFRLTRNADI
jgi:polyphosphate kinase